MLLLRAVFILTLLSFSISSSASFFEDEAARRAILDLRQKMEALEQARAKENNVSDVTIKQIQTDISQFKKEIGDLKKEDSELKKEVNAIKQEINGVKQEIGLLKARLETAQIGQEALKDDNTQLKLNLLNIQMLVEKLTTSLSTQIGRSEQLTKDLGELQTRQRDLVQGVDERFKKMEPLKVSQAGSEFMAEPAEIKQFNAALAVLQKSDFKQASQAFNAFLARYPTSGYQSIAFFWLGSAQYANAEYREAIASFKSSLQANPSSTKAPEALLAMANSEVEMKNLLGAKQILEDLVKRYPQSEAAVAARERLSRMK